MKRQSRGRPGRGGLEVTAEGRTEAESTESPELDGRYLRDVGAERAGLSVHTFWRLAAEKHIGRLAESGDEFTSDQLHQAVGAPPGHASSVGALFLTAAKRDLIEAVGYRRSARPEAHARIVTVWRGTGRRRAEVPR